jgi:hypothetical protein
MLKILEKFLNALEKKLMGDVFIMIHVMVNMVKLQLIIIIIIFLMMMLMKKMKVMKKLIQKLKNLKIRLKKLKMSLKFFFVKNVGQVLLILLFLFLNVVIYFVKIVLKIV